MNVAIGYLKADCCSHRMASVTASRSWINMQKIVFRIVHNLQDMRMPADKYIGSYPLDIFACLGVVPLGVSTDMGHQYRYSFSHKVLKTRVNDPDPMVVDIAVYRNKRFKSCNMVGQFQAPYVACVP